MHVVSSGRVVAFAFLAIAGLAACRHVPGPATGLVAPTVRVGVGNLSESERQRVERFFQSELPRGWKVVETGDGAPAEASLRGGAIDVETGWVVHLTCWDDLEELDRSLTGLRDDRRGHHILKNVGVDADLYYTSSDVESTSEARITIRVYPPDAALVLDTVLPIPGAPIGRPVPTEDGAFTFRLPFSFIRSSERYVYFHSEYLGQYRYYRYDLDQQRQELIEGVPDPGSFDRAQRR